MDFVVSRAAALSVVDEAQRRLLFHDCHLEEVWQRLRWGPTVLRSRCEAAHRSAPSSEKERRDFGGRRGDDAQQKAYSGIVPSLAVGMKRSRSKSPPPPPDSAGLNGEISVAPPCVDISSSSSSSLRYTKEALMCYRVVAVPSLAKCRGGGSSSGSGGAVRPLGCSSVGGIPHPQLTEMEGSVCCSSDDSSSYSSSSSYSFSSSLSSSFCSSVSDKVGGEEVAKPPVPFSSSSSRGFFGTLKKKVIYVQLMSCEDHLHQEEEEEDRSKLYMKTARISQQQTEISSSTPLTITSEVGSSKQLLITGRSPPPTTGGRSINRSFISAISKLYHGHHHPADEAHHSHPPLTNTAEEENFTLNSNTNNDDSSSSSYILFTQSSGTAAPRACPSERHNCEGEGHASVAAMASVEEEEVFIAFVDVGGNITFAKVSEIF